MTPNRYDRRDARTAMAASARVRNFQDAWRAMGFTDRVNALEWIQAGAIEATTPEELAREWEDPS